MAEAGARPHGSILLDADRSAEIEALRQRWDPGMASVIPAHLTVLYPEEAPSPEQVARRLAEVVPTHAAFRLRTRAPINDGDPSRGVFLAVDDVDGGFARLRAALVAPPFTGTDVPPHVTIVHPRTSSNGASAWDALRRQPPPPVDIDVTTVAVTQWDGERWAVVQEVRLGS